MLVKLVVGAAIIVVVAIGLTAAKLGLYDLIKRQAPELRQELEWGYMIPYAITGCLNQHPRAAIAVRKTENKDKYVEFYSEIFDHLD